MTEITITVALGAACALVCALGAFVMLQVAGRRARQRREERLRRYVRLQLAVAARPGVRLDLN